MESQNAPRRTSVIANSSNSGADGTEINRISGHHGPTFGVSASLMRESVVEPKFTRDAMDAGFEGLLVVDLLVDELGRVTKARLINPSGFRIDDEAILAAQTARYRPAQDLGGRPVASSAELRFEFRAH
jgi:TonB family protein